ncbi:MAG: iron-sulfur cluster assembly scaffold protein [Pseudomonadota bacterium]
MTDLSDLYSERILALAAAIPRTARLDAPDATAEAHSKLCGSAVTVDLKMQDGAVVDYGQTIKACLLGQTAASVMGREIIGRGADELRALRADMQAMLKDDGPPPSGDWADLAVLETVRDYPQRHVSAMLVFDAVVDAIGQIEGARTPDGSSESESPAEATTRGSVSELVS